MILAIIQARMDSSRLPGKVLLDLCGKPVLQHIAKRLAQSQYIDHIIVATSKEVQDDRIYNFCLNQNIDCFRGSESNVLERFYTCAQHKNLKDGDYVVRITADCPLIDPNIIDMMISHLDKGNIDYISNTIEPTYPDGLDAEIFTFNALEKAYNDAILPSDKEHVTPYIKRNNEQFNQISYKNEIDYSHLRWTLDEQDDYTAILKIYEALYQENSWFSTETILNYLDEHEEVSKINARFIRNEGYLKSLLMDKVN